VLVGGAPARFCRLGTQGPNVSTTDVIALGSLTPAATSTGSHGPPPTAISTRPSHTNNSERNASKQRVVALVGVTRLVVRDCAEVDCSGSLVQSLWQGDPVCVAIAFDAAGAWICDSF
jgi:hypothetical protein